MAAGRHPGPGTTPRRDTYVAAYHTSGHYSATSNYFATAPTNGPLTAPASSTTAGNGVCAYSASDTFPYKNFNATNDWGDVTFLPGGLLPL